MDVVLNNMFAHWNALKKKEKICNRERVEAERQIQEYLRAKNLWKRSGTMSFGNFNIRINFRRKWDQKQLVQIQRTFFPDVSVFPFMMAYKEILKQSRHLFEHEPTLWQKVKLALSITQVKPYFFEGSPGL